MCLNLPVELDSWMDDKNWIPGREVTLLGIALWVHESQKRFCRLCWGNYFIERSGPPSWTLGAWLDYKIDLLLVASHGSAWSAVYEEPTPRCDEMKRSRGFALMQSLLLYLTQVQMSLRLCHHILVLQEPGQNFSLFAVMNDPDPQQPIVCSCFK